MHNTCLWCHLLPSLSPLFLSELERIVFYAMGYSLVMGTAQHMEAWPKDAPPVVKSIVKDMVSLTPPLHVVSPHPLHVLPQPLHVLPHPLCVVLVDPSPIASTYCSPTMRTRTHKRSVEGVSRCGLSTTSRD